MKRRLLSFVNLTLLGLLILSAAACGGSANYAPALGGPPSGATSSDHAEGYSETASGETPAMSQAPLEGSGLSDGEALRPAAYPTPGTASLDYGAIPPVPGDTSKPAAGGGSDPVSVGKLPQDIQYHSSLTAGKVDDNAKFDDYLNFLNSYQGPLVLRYPVTQRMFVRVVDGEQQPVAGARVEIFVGQRAVFDGSTVSDGRVLFLPEAAGATQAQEFRAVISRGQQEVEANLKAGVLEQTVSLTDLKDNLGAVGLDIVFLLDSTGSMDDEIDKIKATVDSVSTRIAQLPGSSAPRLGLVAYRDLGDDYVTRSWGFANVQEFRQNLSNVYGRRGGDYPESVNAGLGDAIDLQGWSDNSTGRRLRLIILIGDAPPHLDYPNDPAYTALLQKAVKKGIKIFPIGASGLDDQGEYIFRQFAQVTQGQFVFLTYANGVSGAPGMATTHSVSDFTVENLDSLLVNLVAGEVANQTGQHAQSNTRDVATVVAPRPREWLTSVLEGVRSFTNSIVNWSTAFWLVVLGIVLSWAGRSPLRARMASVLPRRKSNADEGDDIVVPEITLEKAPIQSASQIARRASLPVTEGTQLLFEQHTVPL